MSNATASPCLEPPPVRELLFRFAQLSEVTAGALQALGRGDVDELNAFVERREQILALAAPLLQQVRLLQQRSGAAVEPGLQAAVAAVLRAGQEAHLQSQHLMAAIARQRSAILAEMKQMNSADAARAAYSPPAPARAAR